MNVTELVKESLFEISSYPYGIAPPKRKVKARLSSNESPLPLPRDFVLELSKALSEVNRYPSPSLRVLEEKVANYVGVKPENIVIGNGSTELISVLVGTFIKPNEATIISIPTFAMYEALTRIAGGRVKVVKMKSDFRWNVDGMLRAISPEAKIVFICSPNNPTGNTISKEDLVKIARENVVVAVDEAYVEFAGESAVNLIGNYGNLFIIRTFSKAFGLAGLRIGYAITSPELAGLMRRIMPPFPVSVVALKAAEWVLDNSDYVMEVVKVVEEGRRYLFSKLSEIESIKVYPSKANFLLINLGGTGFTSTQVVKVLAEKGVFIRDCSGFRGLGKDYVRVTVGRMEENEAFLKEFKEVINA